RDNTGYASTDVTIETGTTGTITPALDPMPAGWMTYAATDRANTFTAGGQVIEAGDAETVPLTLRGAEDQAADLQQWQDSDETVLGVVTSDGRLGIGTDAPAGKVHVEGAFDAVAENTGNARVLVNVDTNNNPSIELHR